MSQGCAAGGRRHDRQGLPLPGRRPGQGRSLRQLRVLPPRLSRVLNLHGRPEGGAVIQAEARSTVLTGQHFMNGDMASMNCILGASWAGLRTMTATSGPGFSLMQENIGLGILTETPCVVVNVMRGAPSTGLPTLVGQGDVMQAKWG